VEEVVVLLELVVVLPGVGMVNTMLKQMKLLTEEVEVDLLMIILLVLGLVMQMVEHLQDLKVLVVVVTAMLVANLEELVEVVVVQVIIITRMVQDLVEVVW
jgi:hypothetical protein